MVRVWRSCAKTGELFWFDSQGSRVFGERVRVFFGCANRSTWGRAGQRESADGVGGNGEGEGGGVEPCGGTEGTGEAWHGNACQVCAL